MSLAFILLFNLLTINRNVDLAFCDIKGNVKNPGVYFVSDGDVINDIILKAGGLKKNSYVKNINLSKKVTDEMVINIMTIDEYEELTKECPICECEVVECDEVTTTKVITTENIVIEESTTKNEVITTTSQITTQLTTNSNEKININTASVEELMNLAGIGEVTAKKIIEYRIENPFLVIEDILNVSGIGDKLFAKIKDYITV